MAGCRRKFEDLDITRHELEQIGEALKKEEFRKLLADYVEEVNDPENKKQFQKEVTQLEKERGYDVTFVNPEPGYVIKTSVDDEKKAFINVCKSEKIQRPSSVVGSREGSYGRNWSLPYSQAPPREDLDNARNRCVVYDVVFHPEALQLADWNVQFRNMLNDTALDAVEKNYDVKLDRKNLKFPKMKYKGLAVSTVIRKKSTSTSEPDQELDDLLSKLKYPYDDEQTQESVPKRPVDKNQNNAECQVNKTPYTTPKYVIKHRNIVDCQDFTNDRNTKLNATVPKEIVVEIDLPMLSSTREAVLDVTEKTLSLKSEKSAKYKLNITLPYTVNEDAGIAKFDKSKHKLCITLPLKQYPDVSFVDFGREDSGVESDIGIRSHESSSGEDESTDNETKNSPPLHAVGHKVISKIEEINGEINKDNANDEPTSKASVSDNGCSEQSGLRIEVTKCTKDETVVEISPFSKDLKQDEKESESSEDYTALEISENKRGSKHPMLQKCRTLSESSGDEMSFSPSRKGILKRISRSLSESSADDYTWSSSLDLIMQSGSDSCIPEEEGQGIKKTVRFNEVVHQQTYRSNSSIFGQKKKNQRKTRNKKRAQERRASESENSDGEGERDDKTEKNEENGEEDLNGNDEELPEVNDGDEVFEIQLKLQDEKPQTSNKKNIFGKGKRKVRKPGVKLESKKEESTVNLKNDLIFDLDL